MSHYFKNKKQFIVILVLFSVFSYLVPVCIFAEVMFSETYRLQTDDISIGAIGEMRDFSDPLQKKDAPEEKLFNFRNILGLTLSLSKSFNFSTGKTIVIGIAGFFLFMVLAYLLAKKYLFFSKKIAKRYE